jgi:hypothetical protein
MRFDDVADVGAGETAADRPDRRRGEDHVADFTKPDEQNAFAIIQIVC